MKKQEIRIERDGHVIFITFIGEYVENAEIITANMVRIELE